MKPMKPLALQEHHDGLGLADLMTIYADEPDPKNGNASHEYVVVLRDDDPATDVLPHVARYEDPEAPPGTVRVFFNGMPLPSPFNKDVATIQFQHGPRTEPDSESGILDGVLVAILLNRFRAFQAGPYSCRENAIVITKLEETLMWIQHRARRRRAQGTLGTRTPEKQP